MYKPMMLIINPRAGKGTAKGSLIEMMDVLYKGGMIPTVYFTSGPGNGRQLVQEHGDQYDLIVCIGGDGTLSDVMSGVMTLEHRPKLGYIPMGTANDMASTLGLSRDPVKMAEIILGGKTLKYDIGMLGEGGFFSYIAAFGAFTEVSYRTPQDAKNALGHLAYLLEGISALPKITHYHTLVEYEGGSTEQDLVFGGVTNSTSVAGILRLDNDLVELGDGLFEIFLVKKVSSVQDMRDILAGALAKEYNNEAITLIQSPWVRFTFDQPVAWTRDGESGGVFTQVEINNRCGAVDIIVG